MHIGSGSYKGIEDLVVTEQTKICMKRTQVDVFEKEERFLNIYLNKLNEEEKEIIELRYLNENKKIETYDTIAKKIKVSESTVRRKHKAAIENIAFYKFGDESIEKIA